MSTTEALQEAPLLLFTDAAARKVGDLIRGEGNPKLMLRGCSCRVAAARGCSTAFGVRRADPGRRHA